MYESNQYVKYIKFFETDEKQKKNEKVLSEYVRANFTNKTNEFMFFMVDPFNFTYNPAKNIHFDKSEQFYPQIFIDKLDEYIN